MYWSYAALGEVFGPFINRNHFPYYINMCIGLGIGLLVSRSWRDSASPRRNGDAWQPEQSNSFLRILHDPPALWTCAMLGLMVSSVALCRSRGGMLALVGAAVLCAVLGRLKLAGSFHLGVALPVGVVAFALSGWFGLGLVKERLDMFWSGEAFDTRVPLWMRSLPIAADFPVLGTGYGTYGYIEPVYRVDVPAKEEMLLYDHAHNDYLEILVECGIPGLLLAVLTIAVVYRLGYRALGQQRGSPAAGLTLGALFAFTTLVLHSLGEFGRTSPPSRCWLRSCAPACAQGRSNLVDRGSWIVDRNNGSRSTIHDSRERDEYRLRLGGLAPLFGAFIALSLGLVLCGPSGWKEHRINRLQAAAAREGESTADQLRRRIPLLAVAAAAGRDDATLQCELGRARSLLFELDKFGHPQGRRAESAQATRALQAYLQARDACPVLIDAQLGIAAGATRLAEGDPQEAYLNRVKQLSRSQAERWFSCGRLELDARHEEAAWASWRRSLELSDSCLARILPAAPPI